MMMLQKSVQILQEEMAIQHSLLEAEIRRQAEQMEALESQKILKRDQLTDTSTQCDIVDCMFRYSDGNITTNNEPEESTVADEEISSTDEHNKLQDFTMELKSINSDSDPMDDMTKPESQESTSPSFPIFEENTSAKSLTIEEDKAILVQTLSTMEEYTPTSGHLPVNNRPLMTPPSSLPTIQSDANIHPGGNDCSDLDFTTSPIPQEITPLSGRKLEQVSMTNENDLPAMCQPTVPDGSNVPFPFPDITIPDNETDEVNHVISSSERCRSLISKEGAQSTQDKNSVSVHLIPTERSRPTISLIPDQDTNPIKTMENVYTTTPEPDQNVQRSIWMTPPEKDTPSHPGMSPPQDLNAESSVHSINTLPITNKNINMEDQSHCTASNSLPDMKTHTAETTEEDVTANEIDKRSILSINTDSGHQSSELRMLSDDLLETQCQAGPTIHTRPGEEAKVDNSDSGDRHTELWWLSERLRKCVEEIRNLLVTEGFHTLADVLEERIQDGSSEGLSTNLTQLENFPTVLQSLLHNFVRKKSEHEELRDGHSSDSVISSLPLKHSREESQKQDGLPMKTYLGYDFGRAPSLIFTRTDEEHNKRELYQACCQGRISTDIYQDTSRMMSRYRVLCRERLHCLVWGYIQYISWNRAESLLRRQCLSRPETSPGLYKLQKRKDQARLKTVLIIMSYSY
ncbi:uncharacterized protein LOC142302504 [Anomaloglossus baeobatrachus]|uniref:uncharacterized protein LOC142302504 n=1 Tax=Anomaloglossus baeobatrachus TaxID=238106 RepID=UPI003F503021